MPKCCAQLAAIVTALAVLTGTLDGVALPAQAGITASGVD